MKKIALALAFALLAGALASCGSGGGDAPAATTAQQSEAGTTSAAETSETAPLTDDLPKLDFGGYEFKVYSRYAPLYFSGPLDTEAENGEVVNDAIFKRNRTVEERLNIVFTEKTFSSSKEGNDAPRKLLLSADGTYDMFMSKGLQSYDYAVEGMITEFTALEYVDLEKPWWDQSLTEALRLNGKLYFAVDAYNLSSYEFTHMLLFNKQMRESLSLDDPYKLVTDDKWTYDSFHRLAKAAVSDLDGDGAFGTGDRYGLISQPKQVLPCFWISAGVLSIDKKSDGDLYFAAAENKKFSDVYQRIFEITRDDNIWFVLAKGTDDVNEIGKLFVAGQALFLDVDCNRVPALRDMDTDFGILPFPKYDEKQDMYYSRIEGCELPLIPKTNTEYKRTGAVLEALSSESPSTVLKAYYDVALKSKYTRDEVSVEMLNIIFGNRVYDLGDTILTSEIRDGLFNTRYFENNRDLASTLASMAPAVNAKLKTFNGD